MPMTAAAETTVMDILGKGVYTIAEASRLTHLRAPRVREWFRGRETTTSIATPVFNSDYPIIDEEYAISFLDLIELNIGGKLREAGIPLQRLRTNYKVLRDEFGDHPFCKRTIFTKGKQIFTRGLTEEEGAIVTEVMTRQSYFDTIIMPFLRRIDYDGNVAARWNIADKVVIDPQIRFGKPIVAKTGIMTSVLHRSYYANYEDADIVARWFKIPSSHVRAAVEFEDSLAA